MKKTIVLASMALFLAGASMALSADGGKKKCCKNKAKTEQSCSKGKKSCAKSDKKSCSKGKKCCKDKATASIAE